ncbi:hypothetical protein JCGZ_02693 [Jatropha curcas]|uniref:Phytocyanin domain-containing protein n=1 Tax=Jatropha curcas TaxID=180498 RepID=A0A067KXI1_JATCU|nr:blue copper protein 1a [Jatropha curcas]KDP39673.1 hypothetical protein JCGZ_02693 [Jatropha curcas]
MASDQAFIIFVLFVAIAPITILAEEHVVGDEYGWTPGFDYQAWAKDKTFQVGDKLVFQYPVGAHNVFKVNGTAFQNCTKPPLQEALTTGNDTIILATPGRKWYICGVGKHCLGGQKLAITVLSQDYAWSAPAPSPLSTTEPSATRRPFLNFH